MIKVAVLLTTGLIVMVLASPADAARRDKRAPAGPLIMSGMWGPQAAYHRESARGANICKPVTIRRGGWSSAARKSL
jgi:hypothetical protein